MAIRRYKAGTIFLDVAPSFDGVQNAIRDFVKKKVNPDLERAAKRDGEKYGEAFAEGLEKTQGKAEREAAERAAQQQTADLFYANRLVPVKVDISQRIWRPSAQ